MRKCVFPAVVLLLTLMPFVVAANPDPIIRLDPVEFTFDDTEVGGERTTVVRVSNTGGHDLILDDIKFYNGGAANFAILTKLAFPYHVAPGDFVDVTVAFRPIELGEHTARVIFFNNDFLNQYAYTRFWGTGTEPTQPITIDDILDFIDEAVDQGELDGVGPCPPVRRARLRVFKRMLMLAGRFHDRGNHRVACILLNWALLRSDGVPRPSDFVAGDALQQLSDMIVWVLADWGCE